MAEQIDFFEVQFVKLQCTFSLNKFYMPNHT